MSTFYKHNDKTSGDGLAITDWNELSNAVAGNQGLHLALDATDKVGIGTDSPSAKLGVAGDTSLGGNLDVTGATGIDGDFDIAEDKFTVASSTGDTVTKGSLTVEGDIDAQSNLVISGNLTVNGTTTTTNSTTVTINDPVLTLGGDTASSADDSKDRGIEFKYYDDQARVGFFGFDKSAKEFTFLTDATNSSEVFSGTDGALRVGSLSVSGTGDSSFNGSVGIGTTSPSVKLEVNGTVKATSFEGNGASLTNLNASEITGQITLDHLPQEIKNLLPPRIGEEIHGGIVFATGLVCATSDQNTGNWETCKTSCENYNGGGYSDWRMPTKAELNLIYKNLHQSNIGGFASAWYWAYAENTTNSAWNQNFVNGYQNYGYKYYAGRVRAVRAF